MLLIQWFGIAEFFPSFSIWLEVIYAFSYLHARINFSVYCIYNFLGNKYWLLLLKRKEMNLIQFCRTVNFVRQSLNDFYCLQPSEEGEKKWSFFLFGMKTLGKKFSSISFQFLTSTLLIFVDRWIQTQKAKILFFISFWKKKFK